MSGQTQTSLGSPAWLTSVNGRPQRLLLIRVDLHRTISSKPSRQNLERPPPCSWLEFGGGAVGALAMVGAGTTDPNVWVNKVIAVSNPPGKKCYNYVDCVALLKKGEKINYEGASGPMA